MRMIPKCWSGDPLMLMALLMALLDALLLMMLSFLRLPHSSKGVAHNAAAFKILCFHSH